MYTTMVLFQVKEKKTRCNKKKKRPQITSSYSLKTRYRALKKIHRMKKKPTNILAKHIIWDIRAS